MCVYVCVCMYVCMYVCVCVCVCVQVAHQHHNTLYFWRRCVMQAVLPVPGGPDTYREPATLASTVVLRKPPREASSLSRHRRLEGMALWRDLMASFKPWYLEGTIRYTHQTHTTHTHSHTLLVLYRYGHKDTPKEKIHVACKSNECVKVL